MGEPSALGTTPSSTRFTPFSVAPRDCLGKPVDVYAAAPLGNLHTQLTSAIHLSESVLKEKMCCALVEARIHDWRRRESMIEQARASH